MKNVEPLTNSKGTLSNMIPSAAIESANSMVGKLKHKPGENLMSPQVSCMESRKGMKPRVHSAKHPAEIGKLAYSISHSCQKNFKKVGKYYRDYHLWFYTDSLPLFVIY